VEQPLAGNTMSQLQVVCGLVWRQGLFLAARKKAGKTNAGLWELPGGKVGQGETPEQALVREFQEELGMELKVGRVLGSVEQAGAANLRLIALEASCALDCPSHSSDHDSVVWVAPEFWRLLNWCGNDDRLLKQILGAFSRG
jgi:8-oxo-dGTP diphosphatase